MSFIKITEQNSLYNDLERKSVRDLLEDINTEEEFRPRQSQNLVLQIVPLHEAGRTDLYLGAGTSGGEF